MGFNFFIGFKEKFYLCNLDFGGWYSLVFMVCKFDEFSSYGFGIFRKKKFVKGKK